MKWVALFGLLVFTPLLASILRSNPRYFIPAAFVLGLMPFLMGRFNLGAAPISWPTWQGTVKGMEITIVDAVAVALLFASSKTRTPALLKIGFGLFAFAVMVGVALSPLKMASSFYAWQVFKTGIVFLAVARATAMTPAFSISLITGGIIGLTMNASAATLEHLRGTLQSGGWFGHQNLLGMAAHFIIYPAFAMLLSGRHQGRALLALLAALLVAFAGGSRATIGLMVVGLILTAVLSARYRVSGRKIAFGVAALMAIAVSSPLLLAAVDRRSEEARQSSNDERAKMEEAAAMIVADYPFGVGPNRYVVVTNVEGYSARAMVGWNAANRGALVHNTYYLVAAEMGWLGLFSWIVLCLTTIVVGIRSIRRATDPTQGELAAGLSASLIVVCCHMYFEWITMTIYVHYLAAMAIGILVGIGNQRVAVIPKQRGRDASGGDSVRIPSPAF